MAEKFGYVFFDLRHRQEQRGILNALRQRFPNDPDTELRIAVEETAQDHQTPLGELLEL